MNTEPRWDPSDKMSAASRTALLLGATGETGKEVLRSLANSEAYGKVVLVGRREIQLDKELTDKKVRD